MIRLPLLLLALFLFPLAGKCAEEPTAVEIPRVILSFFDSKKTNGQAWFSNTHKYAELPLNHLGLVVRYQDIHQPLPDPNTLDDVRGVLWWEDNQQLANPVVFLEWAITIMNVGKRFVLMGPPPLVRGSQGSCHSCNAHGKILANAGIWFSGPMGLLYP
ncbi:MAG: hypothetical protein HQL76_13320 [Magnetococcales bacterium]|nr:hypothetical protein [Magnetococcales bacterium]